LDDGERNAETVEAHQRASREFDRLRTLLGTVRPLDDVQVDPYTVQPGDTMIVDLAAGARETYTIVHALEAPAHDTRISVDSPFGRAVLGSAVGDTVEESVAERSYRHTVQSVRRDQESRRSAR
jgi:transcription elongation factor GreA